MFAGVFVSVGFCGVWVSRLVSCFRGFGYGVGGLGGCLNLQIW